MLTSKDYYIDLINSTKANVFTSYYHYSGVGFKKAKINQGIYRKDNNLLVGVLQWGCSAQEGIRLDRYVKDGLPKEKYLELNRFCMADEEGKNAESQAIALGIKWIKTYRPDIELLVSYSGRKEGNYGYIYQATNWEYLGYFISDGFWLVNGEERHTITLWNRYKNSTYTKLSFKDALCAMYHDVRQTWTKQFIYIQRLNKKLIPASDILPYPKPSNEFPICTKVKVYNENEEYKNSYKQIRGDKPIYYYEKETKLFVVGEKRPCVAAYSKTGELEFVANSITEMSKLVGGTVNSISRVLSNGKLYNNYWFRNFEQGATAPDTIEVQFLCEIDGIRFLTQSEVVSYFGISRQAVSQSTARKAKTICNKEVKWY